jgi:hypothetical protein
MSEGYRSGSYGRIIALPQTRSQMAVRHIFLGYTTQERFTNVLVSQHMLFTLPKTGVTVIFEQKKLCNYFGNEKRSCFLTIS